MIASTVTVTPAYCESYIRTLKNSDTSLTSSTEIDCTPHDATTISMKEGFCVCDASSSLSDNFTESLGTSDVANSTYCEADTKYVTVMVSTATPTGTKYVTVMVSTATPTGISTKTVTATVTLPCQDGPSTGLLSTSTSLDSRYKSCTGVAKHGVHVQTYSHAHVMMLIYLVPYIGHHAPQKES